MDSDFFDLLNDQVRIAKRIDQDQYGKPVYGEEQVYKCRIENNSRQVLNAKGEVVLAASTIYFAETGPFVGLADQITLQDGRTPTIISINSVPDERGPYYTEVTLP